VRHNVSTLHDSPRPAMCLCFDALDKILLANRLLRWIFILLGKEVRQS
jgi:hypothetical protein